MKADSVFVLVSSLVVSSGCLVGGILGGGMEGDLRDNRRAWEEANIDSYTYHLERQCFCLPFGPADVTVVAGQVVSVVSPGDGTALPVDGYETIDELFERVDSALKRHAFRIDVTYDDVYGFPVRISIDYIEHGIDDEITLLASAFVPNR